MRWVVALGHDVRHAARSLAATPAVSLAAITTLALGIGLAAALFAVAHALLLAPLPYGTDADRLVRLVGHVPAADPAAPPRRLATPLSEDDARALTSSGTLERAGIVAPTVVGLPGIENAGHIGAIRLSADAWRLLEATPQLGRGLAPDDHRDGDVAVIGHDLWRRRFNGDPTVVGRTILLDTVLGRRASRRVSIVGVMPPTFAFPAPDTQIWMPLAPPATGAPPPRGRLLARLAAGVSPDAAIAAVAPAIHALLPGEAAVRYELVRERDELIGPVRPALRVLLAAGAALLLIAGFNVANLLLARALVRHRELAVRAALGASRGRLAREGIAESVLLGLGGGAGGVATAHAAVAAFRAGATSLPRIDLTSTGVGWGAPAFPRLEAIGVEGAVVAFAVIVAIVAGLAVGAAVAHGAAALDVVQALRAGAGARGAGGAGRPLRRGLVVLQVAGAVALLIVAVLLARSLQTLLASPPGFRAEQVLTFQVAVPAGSYPDDRLLAFAETLAERLRGVPGIDAAAYANQVPMVGLRDTAGGLWTTPDAARRPAPDAADARLVSREYFAALGIRVVAGRGFGRGDGRGQPRVLVVNEALVRRQFPDGRAVGRQVYVGRDTAPWTVVGVVADVRQFGLDRAPEPQFFADLRQWTGGVPLFPGGAYFAVRSSRPVAALVGDVRAAARSIDAGAALFNVAPLDTIVAATVTRPRLYAGIVGGIAGVGTLLAIVGLYGVLAHLVQERTAEIGLRMALGASRGRVLRLVLGQAATLVAAGLALGTAAAAALGQLLARLLYGVTPTDPGAMGGAILGFAAVALLAALLPAGRATRIAPLEALHRD